MPNQIGAGGPTIGNRRQPGPLPTTPASNSGYQVGGFSGTPGIDPGVRQPTGTLTNQQFGSPGATSASSAGKGAASGPQMGMGGKGGPQAPMSGGGKGAGMSGSTPGAVKSMAGMSTGGSNLGQI